VEAEQVGPAVSKASNKTNKTNHGTDVEVIEIY
jgi:hypothetical protein